MLTPTRSVPHSSGVHRAGKVFPHFLPAAQTYLLVDVHAPAAGEPRELVCVHGHPQAPPNARDARGPAPAPACVPPSAPSGKMARPLGKWEGAPRLRPPSALPPRRLPRAPSATPAARYVQPLRGEWARPAAPCGASARGLCSALSAACTCSMSRLFAPRLRCRKCGATGARSRCQEKKFWPRVLRERPLAALSDPARARVFEGARRRGAGGSRGTLHFLQPGKCCATCGRHEAGGHEQSSTRLGALGGVTPEGPGAARPSCAMDGGLQTIHADCGPRATPESMGHVPGQAAEHAKSHGSRLRRGAALPSNPSARWVTQCRQRPLPSNPSSKFSS